MAGKLFMLSVFDSAAQTYGQPFFAPAIGVAERNFREAVSRQDIDNMLNKVPTDFDLRLIGEFDEETGKVSPAEIRTLLRAVDVKRAD